MVRSNVDKSGVASNVVNAVGESARNLWAGKIVTLNVGRLLGHAPLPPCIFVVANEFLLFRVDRNNWGALPQVSLDRKIDVPELCIAILVILPLLGLAVALQAVVQVVKNLRDLHVADGMLLSTQCLGDGPRALANPSQRRLGIPTRLLVNQPFQRLHQTRIGLGDRFAAGPGPTDAAHQRFTPSLDLTDPFADRFARQPARQRHHRHPSVSQAHRFGRCHDPSRALVQMRPCGTKLPFQQFARSAHTPRAYNNGRSLDTFIYLQRLTHVYGLTETYVQRPSTSGMRNERADAVAARRQAH